MLDLLLANARMNIGNEDAVLFQIFMYLAAAAAAVMILAAAASQYSF